LPDGAGLLAIEHRAEMEQTAALNSFRLSRRIEGA
jgi:hypothetical protein